MPVYSLSTVETFTVELRRIIQGEAYVKSFVNDCAKLGGYWTVSLICLVLNKYLRRILANN